MKPDVVEFVESTLDLELTEFQKKFLRICYEHKDEMTRPLYLNIGRSQKKVIVEALQALGEGISMTLDKGEEYE